MTPPASGAGLDPAVERAAHLLAEVFERSPRTITELAEVVGIPAIEVAALLEPLEHHNLASRDSTGAVRPGIAALRFARSGIGRDDLVELAQPSMRRLADESGETVNLILPRPAGTEAIAQVDGRHLLGSTNWIGRELGLHCTAAGKVFLAFGAAQLPAGQLARLTPATIVNREQLARELEQIRDQGFGMIVDELEPGLSAVGAPIRDRGGDVIAALTAAGASLRLAPQRLRVFGRVALEQAHVVSTRLGYEASLEEYLTA